MMKRSTTPPAADHRRPRVTARMIEDITRKIVEHFHPEKVILFGSRARGRAGKFSDLDILVIMKSKKGWAARTSEVISVAHPRCVPADFFAFTPREIRERLASGDSFIREILETGRVLFDAQAGGRCKRSARNPDNCIQVSVTGGGPVRLRSLKW